MEFTEGQRVSIHIPAEVEGVGKMPDIVLNDYVIVAKNEDGTYRVRTRLEVPEVEPMDVPAEWIHPDDPPRRRFGAVV